MPSGVQSGTAQSQVKSAAAILPARIMSEDFLSTAVNSRASVARNSVLRWSASRSASSLPTAIARSQAEIQAANDSGRQPVVFVHGLWLLPSSWERW